MFDSYHRIPECDSNVVVVAERDVDAVVEAHNEPAAVDYTQNRARAARY